MYSFIIENWPTFFICSDHFRTANLLNLGNTTSIVAFNTGVVNNTCNVSVKVRKLRWTLENITSYPIFKVCALGLKYYVCICREDIKINCLEFTVFNCIRINTVLLQQLLDFNVFFLFQVISTFYECSLLSK